MMLSMGLLAPARTLGMSVVHAVSGGLVLAALAVAPLVAQAQCRTLEFAELNSLDDATLLRLRCQYRSDIIELGIASIGASATNPRASAEANRIQQRCREELARMDRILARRDGVTGTDAEVARHYRDRCTGGSQ